MCHLKKFYLQIIFLTTLLSFFLPTNMLAGSFSDILRGKDALSSGQDSTNTNLHINFLPVKQAGNNLVWSRNLMYGANMLGYISGFVKGGTIFSIASSVSAIAADYNVGMAGSRLNKFANLFDPNKAYLLSEAGNNLQSYRTLSLIGTGISLIGSIIFMNALNKNSGEDEISSSLTTFAGFSIAAITLKYLAVNKVGKAGKLFARYATPQKSDWKKYYLSESARELVKYKDNWKQGLGLMLGGGVFILTGLIPQSPELARIGIITGGLTILFGHIFMSWIAPTNLGSAGNDLENFEERLRNTSEK